MASLFNQFGFLNSSFLDGWVGGVDGDEESLENGSEEMRASQEKRRVYKATDLMKRAKYANAADEFAGVNAEYKEPRVRLCEAAANIGAQRGEAAFGALNAVWPSREDLGFEDKLLFFYDAALAFFLLGMNGHALKAALTGMVEQNRKELESPAAHFEEFIKVIFEFYPDAIEEARNLSDTWLADFFLKSFDRKTGLMSDKFRPPARPLMAENPTEYWLEKIKPKDEVAVERAAFSMSEGKFSLAVEQFGIAADVTESAEKKLLMRYCRHATQLLAHDLQAARAGFEDLLANETQFPWAAHGMCALHHELKYLPDLKEWALKAKSMCEAVGTRYEALWPKVLRSHFPEWKTTRLMENVKKLEKLTLSPPKPVAYCRSTSCQHADLKQLEPHRREMYSQEVEGTAVPFNGFYTLLCSEKCDVNFHAACWKADKKDLYEGMSKEKDILLRNCLTPDCEGKVITFIVVKDNWEEKKHHATLPAPAAVKEETPSTPTRPHAAGARGRDTEVKNAAVEADEPRRKESDGGAVTKVARNKSVDVSSTPPRDRSTAVVERKAAKIAPAPVIKPEAVASKKPAKKTSRTLPPDYYADDGTAEGAISKSRRVRYEDGSEARNAYAQTVDSSVAEDARKLQQTKHGLETEREITYYLFNCVKDTKGRLHSRAAHMEAELDILKELLAKSRRVVSLLWRIPTRNEDENRELHFEQLFVIEVEKLIAEFVDKNRIHGFQLAAPSNLGDFLRERVRRQNEQIRARPSGAMGAAAAVSFPMPPPPLMRTNVRPPLFPQGGAAKKPVTRPQPPPAAAAAARPKAPAKEADLIPLAGLIPDLMGSFSLLLAEDIERVARTSFGTDLLTESMFDELISICQATQDEREAKMKETTAAAIGIPVGAVSAVEVEKRLLDEQTRRDRSDPTGQDCAVCLFPLVENDGDIDPIEKLKCAHFFHKKCIRQWVVDKGNRTCPSCRGPALLKDEFPNLRKN